MKHISKFLFFTFIISFCISFIYSPYAEAVQSILDKDSQTSLQNESEVLHASSSELTAEKSSEDLKAVPLLRTLVITKGKAQPVQLSTGQIITLTAHVKDRALDRSITAVQLDTALSHGDRYKDNQSGAPIAWDKNSSKVAVVLSGDRKSAVTTYVQTNPKGKWTLFKWKY
ncbi:hypothetical protein [Paenibacillus sp. 481]|uniref:hypothetical protein n=1 Tax=Paenibacillus sp. 481 TaxID=2835869 RepID=UPI001E4E4724|nr:hypothetical protein [Paenibacillus sp. 481]UHA73846.1 hypothetical protein KIK04_01365 [Paenibacillus sp. 481]